MKLLGMFAKYWQPGTVKTRLAAAIGPEPASQLYRQFLETLLNRLHGVADRHVLAFFPAERRIEMQSVAGTGWQLWPQSGDDLGQRMQSFFQTARDHGATKTVLIGSDSPNLPEEWVRMAFSLLDDAPVVLGPSEDGGYYLLGVSGQLPDIFAGISWSTPHVWEETTSRLQHDGGKFAVLPQWYDIDELTDLRRMNAELQAAEQLDVPLQRLRDALDLAKLGRE